MTMINGSRGYNNIIAFFGIISKVEVLQRRLLTEINNSTNLMIGIGPKLSSLIIIKRLATGQLMQRTSPHSKTEGLP